MNSEDGSIEFTVFRGSKSGHVVKSNVPHAPLTGDQVLVKITHSGLCGTDEHFRHSDQVLGHEGVGTVMSTATDVEGFKKGDVVGFGYVHSTCGHCEHCLTGRETYCPSRVWYGNGDYDLGSLASHTIWRASYLFHIPSNMSPAMAAPLQCAGATVWNAIEGYDTRPTERVGVIGVGGLGHLAVQMAAKMGCIVVVFSGTESKKKFAMEELGATEFHATAGKDKIEHCEPIDRLIVTTSALPSWELYMPILKPEAKIFPLTVAEGDFSFPALPMIQHGFTIQGTVVAPRAVHQRMLRFCAEHDIRPVVEEFPMTEEGIQEAFEKMGSGGMRYRGVLVAQD